MSLQTRLISARELERMAQTDKRVELVKGEIVEMPPAGHEHGAIGMSLSWRLAAYVEEKGLGRVYLAETGFILTRDPDTVRAPDAAFVSAARLAGQTRSEGFFDGAPDLAVEVVSPEDTDTEVQEKVLEYLAAGTRLVWILRPRFRTVTAYRSPTDVRVLTARDSLDGQDVVPGFAVALVEIFK